MQQNKVILTTFLLVVILLCLLISFLAIIMILYQRKKLGFINQLKEAKTKYDRELLQSQLEVQEQTIQNISREIHDNIGQQFSLAKLHLNAITLEAGNPVAENIGHAVDLLTQALEDLRDISKSLSLETIRSVGLEKAIETHVLNIQRIGQYSVQYEVLGNYNYADEQKEIIVFRILQEAINNIIRHAQAKTITIILDCTVRHTIKLLIKDDGIGFNTSNFLIDHPGVQVGGLRHMNIRADLIDAEFLIDSVPNAGTQINLIVPIAHDYDPTH
jgi:two-component system NarL family sensor kinase